MISEDQLFRQRYFRLMFWSFVSTLLVSLLFTAHPRIDIDFSRLFWNEDTHFFLKHNFIVETVSRNIYWLVIVYLLIAVIYSGLIPNRKTGIQSFAYILTALITGPGLIVNSLLKSYWGRARPQAIQEFGGSADFSTAWHIADQCQTNCSFVSGHAAAGFALYGLCFLLFRQRKPFILAVTTVTIVGLLIGLGRIVEGKHYLSDIIIAGQLVWLSALLCYYPFWMVKR